MTETLRKPAIFSADDPRLVIARPEEAQRPNSDSIAEAPADNLPAVIIPRKRRVPWGTLFWSALSGLVLLALGLAVTNLVEDLYARAPWLGAIGLALALLAGQLLFDFYLVMPVLRPAGFSLSWSDPVTVIAVVGFWLAAWARNLQTS